ncbi:MAG: S24/S26 family peptidase [Saprospiraceae bacterium]|nr:S24/S26 family peptidase [Saprospiraceae bacterium]
MKKNGRFWRNIKWINEYLIKETKLPLAGWLDWEGSQVIALENGGAPTLDQLSQLHQFLGFSYSELIEKDLSSSGAGLLELIMFKEPQALVSEPSSSWEISLHPVKAEAGKGSMAQSRPGNEHLLKICVPSSFLKEQKAAKAFEISGYSMYPTVQSGDVVLAKPLDDMQKIEDGSIYLFQTDTGALLFKRAYHLPGDQKYSGLQLSSDHPEYEPLFLEREEIDKIWKFTHRLGKI